MNRGVNSSVSNATVSYVFSNAQGNHSWTITCANITSGTSANRTFGYDDDAPLVDFVSRVLADITSTNLFGTVLNKTYNVTDALSGLSNATILAYAKTNTTTTSSSFTTCTSSTGRKAGTIISAESF